MPSSQSKEKTSELMETLGLAPSQVEHLLMGLLCMEKRKLDWKKLGELCNVTPSSARTVYTKARRNLEKWDEERIAKAAKTEEAEKDEVDAEGDDEADEAADAQDTEN
ncbi:hypothetical protein PITC_030340 [Penicillium italicum]|uniref:Uncharacterized protein n=1 Tax=Penicillium italicum TaxID=40296 RepID=A0A0A2L6I2_PENIT|nr:hypothetical protein PITC_030340 [Penicillium italicum]